MMLWIMFCILCAWWTSLFCSIAKHVKVLTKWLIWCQINCWVQTIARRRTPGAEPCNDKPLLEPISMVKLYMEPFFTTGQKENSVPYQSFSVTLRSPRFIATLCSVISLLHCNIFFFINGICYFIFPMSRQFRPFSSSSFIHYGLNNFRSPGNRPVKNAKTNERAIIDYPRPRPTCYFHCWNPGVGTKQ